MGRPRPAVAVGALLCVGAFTAALWVAFGPTPRPPGRFDAHDVGAYVRLLNRSSSPLARRIREQLASARRDLDRERASLAADGLPVKPADLQRPAPPAARNAAPDYVRLMFLLRARPLLAPRATGDPIGALAGREPPSSGDVEAARRILAGRPDVTSLVHQAADKPECVFQRQWRQGPSLLLPEFAAIRQAARIISAESYLLARAGRCPEAAVNQARGLRTASHAASDPCVIGYLGGVACDRIALVGMDRILQRGGRDPGVCDAVRQAIARNRPRLDFAYGLRGEYASMVPATCELVRRDPLALANVAEGVEGGSPHRGIAQRILGWRRPRYGAAEREFTQQVVDASEAMMLHELHETARRAQAPFPQRLEASRKVRLDPANPVHLLPGVLCPVFSQATRSEARARGQEECVMAGAAVLAWKARHGAFPATLAQAAGGSRDPFTGGPLRYRREGDGFVVWSAGPTGQYDGQRLADDKQGKQALFRYPDPPRAAEVPATGSAKTMEPPAAAGTSGGGFSSQGQMSRIRQRRDVAVRDAAAFERLWAEHVGAGGPRPPRVDFARASVVAVFAGARPTGGYRVELGKVDRTRASALVHAAILKPPAGSLVTQAFTYPFAMRAVPRLPARVRFQVTEKARE